MEASDIVREEWIKCVASDGIEISLCGRRLTIVRYP
jgi:hypothetical protein